MLDTGSVNFALRGMGRVAERLLAHRPSEICISSITLSELRFGAERLKSRRLTHAIDAFVRNIGVAPFDDECATTFGRIGSKLAAKGASIGEFDTMIAAHALTLDLTLVTSNTRHFTRVAGLRTENWF